MGITIRNTGQGGKIRFTSLGLGGTFTSIYTTSGSSGGGGGGETFLLDTYTDAAVAFSLRKLRSAYSGNAIRVRRSNDNAEQDIGFVNNQLDTASLSSFVSSNSAFITRWYDQSGNNVTASQATAGNQPRIVNAGTIDSQGGKPSMLFVTSSNSRLVTTTNITPNSYMSTFIVTKMDQTTSTYKFITTIGSDIVGPNFYAIVLRANSDFYNWKAGEALVWGSGASVGLVPAINTSGSVYNNIYALTSIFIGSANTSYYVNNVEAAYRERTQGNVSTNNTGTPLIIGTRTNNSEVYEGYLSELIIYGSNQFSNRSGIQTNINSFYTIY
jgi:hypothetical protein